MPEVIDITRPFHNALPVWPGDIPVQFSHASTLKAGDIVNLGRVTTSLHAGTHVDAPYHYREDGKTIEQIPPETYIGPAQLIDVRGQSTISIDLLKSLGAPVAPRLLIQTGAWNDPTTFPEIWPVMDLDVPGWLVSQGVLLIGLDAPSVDTLTSEDLPRHQSCGEAGLLIVENLLLDGVAPGSYEFIALPLKIVGADGSPVRAVLRRN